MFDFGNEPSISVLAEGYNFAVILSLDTKSVFLQETRNTNIDAEADLGILVNDISEEVSGMPKKSYFRQL